MTRRKFPLPSLDIFQSKLEQFWQKLEADEQQRRIQTEAYMKAVWEYYNKGMTLRDIGKATGIPFQTVHQWIKKMRKKQEETQAHAETS